MKIRELQNLMDAQPSVSGSTFLVGALYVVSAVLAVLFLILGIGALLESLLHFKIFLSWLAQHLGIALNEDQRWTIATGLGITALILFIIFTGVILLCRMVLERNHFIIGVEEWLFQNISELKKPRKIS